MSTSDTTQVTARPAPRRILEDASGGRLRRMRWVGRIVAVFFLVWLLVVILGGLGVGPARHLPFGRILQPSAGPARVRTVPPARRPSAVDLLPAVPIAATTQPALSPAPATVPRGRSASAPGQLATKPAHGRSSIAPGHTAATSPGRSGAAPGQTGTTPGRAGTAPGHSTARGRSTTAPGQARKATTTTVSTTTTVTTTAAATTTTPGRHRAVGGGKKSKP